MAHRLESTNSSSPGVSPPCEKLVAASPSAHGALVLKGLNAGWQVNHSWAVPAKCFVNTDPSSIDQIVASEWSRGRHPIRKVALLSVGGVHDLWPVSSAKHFEDHPTMVHCVVLVQVFKELKPWVEANSFSGLEAFGSWQCSPCPEFGLSNQFTWRSTPSARIALFTGIETAYELAGERGVLHYLCRFIGTPIARGHVLEMRWALGLMAGAPGIQHSVEIEAAIEMLHAQAESWESQPTVGYPLKDWTHFAQMVRNTKPLVKSVASRHLL